MNIAYRFMRELSLIERDERGFYEHSLFNGLVERARYWAVATTYPYGTNSDDPSEKHTFADGSSLHIGNLRQKAYAGIVVAFNN